MDEIEVTDNKAAVKVELIFSDNITEEQLEIIGANVMQALISQVQCSEQGLVGDNFEGYSYLIHEQIYLSI